MTVLHDLLEVTFLLDLVLHFFYFFSVGGLHESLVTCHVYDCLDEVNSALGIFG